MRGPNRNASPPAAMLAGQSAAPQKAVEEPLRIIGGKYRGRKLRYGGDSRTRPMKDRVREAVFNLLGPAPEGKHVVDLFAGTGALALEALSRGAVGATLIERHFPTAAIIRENVLTLGCQNAVQVVAADTFYWTEHQHDLPHETPWLVFCSPPYDFYVSRGEEMLQLLLGLVDQAPQGSEFVVEADERFNPRSLPHSDMWQSRAYPPAHVYMFQKAVTGASP